MSGDPTRYVRYPEVGQFYAIRNPLTLAQVTSVGEFAGGGPGCISFNLWTPRRDNEEGSYVQITQETADYLWFNRKFDWKEFSHTTPLAKCPGDVMLTTLSNKLWFVGPETDKTHLHALALFELSTTDIMMSVLYQPGAGRQEPTRKSAFERVLEESV